MDKDIGDDPRDHRENHRGENGTSDLIGFERHSLTFFAVGRALGPEKSQFSLTTQTKCG